MEGDPVDFCPAIVVAAYRRPHALERLLKMLSVAEYPVDISVPLVISIDGGGAEEVLQIANEFEWKFGHKEVVAHSNNIGLRGHIISCGELTKQYGAIIMLEDDLVVSPGFYVYARSVGSCYANEKRVAQVSLYSYIVSELSLDRFMPLYTGSDIYFMQWASSWGQLWTLGQWTLFKEWYADNQQLDGCEELVPEYVLNWPETSWKKFYIAYMCQTGRYSAFPYFGLSSPYGDDGENISSGSLPVVQSPLSLRWNKDVRCVEFSKCKVRYDSYFQPEKVLIDELNPCLRGYDYVVDFTGERPLGAKYCLSVRPCSKPVYSYDWNVFPWELNVGLGNGARLFFGESRFFCSRMGSFEAMKLALWGHRIMSVPVSVRINAIKLLYWISSRLKYLRRRR